VATPGLYLLKTQAENACQKSGAKGTLEVAIYVGGEEKASNSTSAAYGIASVGYP
jgi:hypothetical protein